MTIEEIERLTDSLSKKINELANTGELPEVEQKRAILIKLSILSYWMIFNFTLFLMLNPI